MGNRSLQQRLLILLLGSVITLWMIVGSIIWSEVRHEAEEVFDANLVQTSKLLLTLIEGELNEAKEHRWHMTTPYQLDEIGQQFHPYEHKVAYQITDLEHNILIRSPHAPEQLLSTETGIFEDRLIDGHIWRIFSLSHPLAIIYVGERIDVRNEVAEEVVEHLTEYVLLSLPILALLIWWSVRQGLHPISAITKDLTERDSHHLNEIDVRQSPNELKPMVDALNHLFSRLTRSMEKERRFISDAAHELRTPLAAIKIHAQVARNSDEDEQQVHALNQIIQGVDRTTHLAEQLLALARVDRAQEMEKLNTLIDLNQVINENIDMLGQRARSGEIELIWNPPESVPQIEGNWELISILFRNLLDNAIRYTPAGGHVTVTLSLKEGLLLATIRDSGSGIPEELQQQIFERFFRNSTTASGSGLGLSITQRIAEIHQADISLKNCNSPTGLIATITFSKVPASSSRD